LYWLKATKTDIPIGKCLVGQTPFFQEENFSLFEVTINGPTIIKLLPLNHRTDWPSDREYS